MSSESTKADGFRKRADAVGKSLKTRSQPQRAALLKKQTALNDLADNEDWLDGKPMPKPTSKFPAS